MSNFQKFGNYRINKWFMRFILIVIVLSISGIFLYYSNSDPIIYFECESTLGCDNPFIDRIGNCQFSLAQQDSYPIYKEVCSKSRLMYTETLGIKPPNFTNLLLRLVMALVVFSIFLNHIIYNRRLKWNEQELKLIQKGLKLHFKKSTKNTIDQLKRE